MQQTSIALKDFRLGSLTKENKIMKHNKCAHNLHEFYAKPKIEIKSETCRKEKTKLGTYKQFIFEWKMWCIILICCYSAPAFRLRLTCKCKHDDGVIYQLVESTPVKSYSDFSFELAHKE